jgi:hypothetical protein
MEICAITDFRTTLPQWDSDVLGCLDCDGMYRLPEMVMLVRVDVHKILADETHGTGNLTSYRRLNGYDFLQAYPKGNCRCISLRSHQATAGRPADCMLLLAWNFFEVYWNPNKFGTESK